MAGNRRSSICGLLRLFNLSRLGNENAHRPAYHCSHPCPRAVRLFQTQDLQVQVAGTQTANSNSAFCFPFRIPGQHRQVIFVVYRVRIGCNNPNSCADVNTLHCNTLLHTFLSQISRRNMDRHQVLGAPYADIQKARYSTVHALFHAREFAAANSARYQASTINCALRTLRCALGRAFEWGKLDRQPRIILASGERQRDRIVTHQEEHAYLRKCRQLWRDCAALILATGMRPDEAYTLTWPQIVLDGGDSSVQILDGKSKAARRRLPLLPAVVKILRARTGASKKGGL